jgi:hypothetical protein
LPPRAVVAAENLVVFQKAIACDFVRASLATGVGYRPPTVTSAAPLQFLILLIASWIGRRQGEAIEYLHAENRVLRALCAAETRRARRCASRREGWTCWTTGPRIGR